jgi:hypothetical protein
MVLSRSKPRPLQLDDMLDLFECRVDVWQLGTAVAILREIESHDPAGSSIWAHSAYALVAVVFSYFEMIGKTLNPESKTRNTANVDFNFGFCDVYSQHCGSTSGRDDRSVPTVQQFRDRVRNGMYHLGYTKGGLFLHNEPDLDDFTVDTSKADARYMVNPHRLTRTVVAHFPTLMHRLREVTPESAALRDRFRTFFTEFHGLR